MNTESCEWLIWSFEHRGWWMPDGWGYTGKLAQAGRYTSAQAHEICEQANRYSVNEKMVHESEVALFKP